MSLWDEAVAVYARPGVKTLCLALQNDHGHCVCYLLWAGWAARRRRFVDAEGLAKCARLARGWERMVLAPARGVAPSLKRLFVRMGAPPHLVTEALLKPERLLLSALEKRTPPVGADLPVAEALSAAVTAWPGSAPAESIAALAAAFSPR